MNSMIYRGEVSHARLLPVTHSFRYPHYFYAFDIDELPELERCNPLFGYNRLRPVSLHDCDYLHAGPEPLRHKLRKVLREAGISVEPVRVMLVTAARYFNYVFNPISFFYCYGGADRLQCVVAQVNNTFGEMHLYLLAGPQAVAADGRLVFAADKQFHVSPFFTRRGRYEFHLSEPVSQLDNQIDYHQDEGLALVARIRGEARPLTTGRLLRTLIRHPLSAVLTMPRILWQASRLYWKRRLPVYTKPIPDNTMTIRPVAPNLFDRIGLALFYRFFSRLPQGGLDVQLPDGRRLHFGRSDVQPRVRIKVNEYRFFRRLLFSGDIGFGEAYTDGDWSTDDLTGLLTLLAAHQEVMNDRSLLSTWLGRSINYGRHLLRANTLKGSSRNIRAHYDLSNDFFATFLDPSMTYSAALFASPQQALADAQRNKIHTLIEKAGIGADDHVLEIGCGWGSFAIEAVRRTGCRVTGITLSHEQLHLAKERVREAGLEERIDLQLCDYRQIEGDYSKIVSIEMLEAVGHNGLRTFFGVCDRLLRPGGSAVIQVITIPDRRYNAYRFSSDWIRKYIFPGGHLPALGVIARAIAASSQLNIVNIDQRGYDYARTLEHWRETLRARREQIRELGYDENFLRTWDYYFAYCEAGFAAEIIDLAQLVLHKPAAEFSREEG